MLQSATALIFSNLTTDNILSLTEYCQHFLPNSKLFQADFFARLFIAATIGGRIEIKIITTPTNAKCALKNGTLPRKKPANRKTKIHAVPPIML